MLLIQSILLSFGIETFGFIKSIVERYLYNDGAPDIEDNKIIEITTQKTCVCTLDEYGLKFWPPLYMQRYMAIQEIIEHPIWNDSIKKVVDFGCSELGLFKCIKPIPGLNNIMLVDVDFNTLDVNQTKVLPTNYDYLSVSERKEPLTVDIYNGSIAELDDRMLGIDAVICIELIEHLYSEVLDAVPHTVFAFIKPKLAMFTTPNVEFNILFPNFTTQFRHDDHKFEWNRKQFKAWAKQVLTLYPDYAVQFDGIGAGPTGTEHLGCCSQIAIFYRKDMISSPADPVGLTPYKLLRRVTYPFELHTIKEHTVYDRIRKFVMEASSNEEYKVNGKLEIPLNIIMPYVSDCCSTINELEYFTGKLYQTKLNDQGEWFLVKAMSETSFDEYKSDSDSLSNHSGQEYSLLEDIVNTVHSDKEEDWNEPMGMSFGESKLCYSTPMTQNKKINNVYLNNVDSFNTIFSNSDLYKTAIDYNNCDDMDISSSCNGSLIVDDCNIYQDFVTGHNNSVIIEEDGSETEENLTCVATTHDLSNDCDIVNANIINDNTVIHNNSNVSLNSNFSSNDLKLKTNEINEELKENDNQLSVCLNRTLLDENGYTEKLLFTPDKEYKTNE